MTIKVSEPENWTDARKAPEFRRRWSEREENVFRGGSVKHVAQIEGVEVVRLSVWPEGTKSAPQSFAVINVESFDSNQGDDEKGARGQEPDEQDADDQWYSNPFRLEFIDWKQDDSKVLPFNLDWQQSKESRWDFFFDLPFEATCHGLGERLSALNLRGAVHTLFNTDDDLHIASMASMYQSIPMLVINQKDQCWALFLDSPARQKWFLDEELECLAGIQLLSRRGFQLYSFGPCSLPDLLAAYTTLTGRGKLPPLWSLGHQQSRWSYPDKRTVMDVAEQYRKRSIPCDTMVLDIDYMEDYRVFTSSQERFPEFKEMIAELGKNNFRVVTIVDPGVKKDPKYFVFNDGKKHGYFCKRQDGKLFLGKVWPGPSAFPDFLREDVRLWWAAQHGFYTENGVSGIWNDMNEPALFGQQVPLPVEATELPDIDNQLFVHSLPEGNVGHFEVRNVYGHCMNWATYDGLMALNPDKRPFVLTRAGYAGIQRFAAVWLGDNYSWWDHLRLSIPMLLNMGISGVPFCGVDIGGFKNHSSPELLVRWYAVGMFYPFFRNHCDKLGYSQEPWAFGPAVEDQCRRLIEWRYRLLPYIQTLFYENLRTGAPLMRPLFWDYPEDPHCRNVSDEFLFGHDILVAPILDRGCKTRTVYLPKGLWHPFEGGEPLEGGRLYHVTFELGDVPAFVRDGAIIPCCDIVQSTIDFDYSPVTFMCYGAKSAGFYFEDDGESLEYERGSFNEWLLQMDNGKSTVTPVHVGFSAPDRKFQFAYDGRLIPVELVTD